MRTHRDWLGRMFALLILATGIGLMLACFWFAYQMFQTPPQRLITNPQTNNPDLSHLLTGVWASVRAILLLALMAIVAGMIANRGITLYLNVRRAEYEESQRRKDR